MLERIQASLPALSPAEQRVGKLCLMDPRQFSKMAVCELANLAHVSKPTVVRFCRSVGYAGLSDFKRKLAGAVNEGVPFVHHSVDQDDATCDVAVKVIDNTMAAFLQYRNSVNMQRIEVAASTLLGAYRLGKRIEFYGVGTSGVVAQDAQHKFFRLGINTMSYCDSHFQVMSATMLGPGDCVVIISNSGRTRDLMDACHVARKKGATAIVITASDSPLASAGTIHLAADHSEQFERYIPMVSRLLHLLIIDILATCVAIRLDSDTLQPLLREVKHSLRNKRYA
jgi:RpiR family transcriptional regulator, carbohydrate utilization regulator